MDKYLFPILMAIIAFILYTILKPTALVTYTDFNYFNALNNCNNYTTSGKLIIPTNVASLSKIRRLDNNKCLVQTENVFIMNNVKALNCIFNFDQLAEISQLRNESSYQLIGFSDELAMKKYIKAGYCSSYTLKDGKWLKDGK